MKLFIMWLICTLTFTGVFGELSEDQMDDLQRYMRISSVRDDTVRDDDRNKIEVLNFLTLQDERDTENYFIRITVELEDRNDETYWAQLMRKQQVVSGYDYAGQDRWEIRIPHGDLNRPRIAAYVIEYGKMDGQTFIPIALEMEDVKSVEEITGRGHKLDEEKASLWHSFTYRDNSGGGQEQKRVYSQET